jgi:ATP-dependent helicase/nuclease subunit A
VLIHRLLERLPELGEGARAAAAEKWLARNAGELDPASHAEIAARALAVLAEPEWAELFGPEALAEAPIAALVGTAMVTGTIDRLLIEPTRIRLIDFKSARRPPASIEDVPRAVLRQMGAYAAALEATFPGRRVEAALLYTQTPQLIAIPAAILDEVKQLLQGAQ